jgi:hypothetical protein
LENKPLSRISGFLQRKRGVKNGLADVQILYRRKPSNRCRTYVVFIELKAPHGVASRSQKRTRLEMLPTGAKWLMARTARAAMTALHHEGVPFCQPWTPSELEPWEGPFFDPTRRLPQHPEVAAERREAARRYRLRREIREREAGMVAQRRSDLPASTRSDGELPGGQCCAPRQRSGPGDPSETKFGP